MIKLALLLSLAAGTAFYAGGRTTYSGLQAQLFAGSGLKMTPDPSNIWSFHKTIQLPRNERIVLPVLVDFDNNQKTSHLSEQLHETTSLCIGNQPVFLGHGLRARLEVLEGGELKHIQAKFGLKLDQFYIQDIAELNRTVRDLFSKVMAWK